MHFTPDPTTEKVGGGCYNHGENVMSLAKDRPPSKAVMFLDVHANAKPSIFFPLDLPSTPRGPDGLTLRRLPRDLPSLQPRRSRDLLPALAPLSAWQDSCNFPSTETDTFLPELQSRSSTKVPPPIEDGGWIIPVTEYSEEPSHFSSFKPKELFPPTTSGLPRPHAKRCVPFFSVK